MSNMFSMKSFKKEPDFDAEFKKRKAKCKI